MSGDEIAALRADLAMVRQDLAVVRAMLGERCNARGLAISDLDDRVTALEQRVWWASGASAVLGIVGGWLLKHFGAGQ